MSVLDKELLLEQFSPDRVGQLSFRAYVGALATSHVTRSDGTLRFDDSIIRWQLLTGYPDVTIEDVAAVRRQLVDLRLIVPYGSEPHPYAFVAKWWVYNTRPDRARRATRTPAVPDDLLAGFPLFAEAYRKVPLCGEKVAKRSGTSRNNRGFPGKGRNTPAPDPEPAPEPVAVEPVLVLRGVQPAVSNFGRRPVSSPQGRTEPGVRVSPRPGPAPNGAPQIRDAVIEGFLASYLECWRTIYRPDPSERGTVVDLLSKLPASHYPELLASVGAYVNQTPCATLAGLCEWFSQTRTSRARSQGSSR